MKKRLDQPRELFEISKIIKKFDKTSGCFKIDIRYKTATTLTPRTLTVAQAFGLGIDEAKPHIIYDQIELRIHPTDIVYITGESGSGKSVLLQRLEQLLHPQTTNLNNIPIDPSQPIIDTVGKTVKEGLELLSKVGLNDAFLFLRNYAQLSDGQKYRYRLARLIENTKKQYWVMDEFCSTLDRDTAKIVAFNIQKLARRLKKAVLAATTHTDLFEDLKPSVHIHKRFGKEVTVNYYPNQLNNSCSLTKKVQIDKGNITDYRKLAQFHYRQSKWLPPPRKIFAMKRKDTDEVIGIIVYSYPPLFCFGRNKTLPEKNLTVKWLNKNLTTISRVILHPKYRSIGLGAKLVKETLTKTGVHYIETVAVMAKYNPFFEKAGMKKLAIQHPHPSLVKTVKKLQLLGVNPVLMSSEKYNMQQLQRMKQVDLEKIKTILAEIAHPRLRRTLVPSKPYPKKNAYQKVLWNANRRKIAKMLRVLSVLIQPKVYLFWENKSRKNS